MIAAAVMIGFSSLRVKLAYVTPAIAGFYRVLFGAVFLTVAAAWKREFEWLGWKAIVLAFVCGFFFALDLLFWHTAIHIIGPGRVDRMNPLAANQRVLYM
jgi:drug/metabolite transporter (DMT)-like permease